MYLVHSCNGFQSSKIVKGLDGCPLSGWRKNPTIRALPAVWPVPPMTQLPGFEPTFSRFKGKCFSAYENVFKYVHVFVLGYDNLMLTRHLGERGWGTQDACEQFSPWRGVNKTHRRDVKSAMTGNAHASTQCTSSFPCLENTRNV